MKRLTQSVLSAVLLATLAGSGTAWADLFILENGGRIHGEWLNRNAAKTAPYEVRTEAGGKLSLARDQVREVVRQVPAESEYERLAPTYADTIEGQWKLAEWCREHNLKERRAVHLLRILDHDPNHVAARIGLGFTQVRGQWAIAEEWKKKEGYELYRNHWRIAQQIELLEERSKKAQFEREWVGKLKRLREALGGEKAYLATQQLLEIRDPHAVPGLLANLRREPLRGVKEIYVETLGKIASPTALQGLLAVSLNDPDIEIFYACLDQLVPKKNPDIVEAYVQALKNENNVRINRAGIALGKLDDKSSIGPLIGALITTHRVQLASGTSSDAYSSSFTNPVSAAGTNPGGGGSGLTAGAAPPKVVPVTVQNPDVLKALVAVSEGASFGYDQRAWNRWHAQERGRLEARHVRRD